MTTLAAPATPATTAAPLTRREIREAERATQRRRGVGSQKVATAIVTAPRIPAPDAVTEVMVSAGPRRRDLRARRRQHVVTWRNAVVGGLGALAVAAPLVGFASHTGSPAAAAAGIRTEPSMLAALEERAAEATTPETLRADPEAPARAAEAEAASRAAEREALAAAEAEAEAAALAAANRVVMPVAEGTYRATSGYGHRVDPLGRGYNEHLGIDLAAPRDTPILAAAAGTVVHAGAGLDGRSSNLVIIEHEIHGETYFTWYVHMYDDGVYVTEGQEVEAGEVIGGVGSNGNSTGNHLHFEVHLADGDTTVEPWAWLQEHGAISR